MLWNFPMLQLNLKTFDRTPLSLSSLVLNIARKNKENIQHQFTGPPSKIHPGAQLRDPNAFLHRNLMLISRVNLGQCFCRTPIESLCIDTRDRFQADSWRIPFESLINANSQVGNLVQHRLLESSHPCDYEAVGVWHPSPP